MSDTEALRKIILIATEALASEAGDEMEGEDETEDAESEVDPGVVRGIAFRIKRDRGD